jgi:antitoxin component of MazEF toxin-antitoxin module
VFTLGKLSRSGNSTHVAIPRQMLDALGWASGQYVVVELQQNGSVLVRRPTGKDFQRLTVKALPLMTLEEVQP